MIQDRLTAGHSLLLHAVEDFFRFSPGGVVHAGLPDLLLKFLYIGHIFRVQLFSM